MSKLSDIKKELIRTITAQSPMMFESEVARLCECSIASVRKYRESPKEKRSVVCDSCNTLFTPENYTSKVIYCPSCSPHHRRKTSKSAKRKKVATQTNNKLNDIWANLELQKNTSC